MKKLYIQTYGCQMNQYDSERIAQVMGRMDYVPTDQIAAADLILLNTCSVRDKAEQKVYSALGRWRELKEHRPERDHRRRRLRRAAGRGESARSGCPISILYSALTTFTNCPRWSNRLTRSASRPVETAFYRDPSYMEDPDGRTRVQGAKAFVTIMQGCNKVCSFCIVPHVRGREVSRPSAKIFAEIESLVRQGVKEVMLLGQNVNSYGKLTPGKSASPSC